MRKTIIVNEEQKFVLDASANWIFIYRAQFGRDILPEFMPMLEAILTVGVGIAPITEMNGAKITDVVGALTDTDIIDAISTLSGMETTTIYQIIWAMAKNGDSNIPDVGEWLKEYEVFPLDTILPAVLKLLIESSISPKNSVRLLKKLKLLKK